MVNSRVILFHGEKTKNQQYCDFPRYHIVTATLHFSFMTLCKKKKKRKEINRNTPKYTPMPLKLADLKVKLEARICYTLIQTLFTN